MFWSISSHNDEVSLPLFHGCFQTPAITSNHLLHCHSLVSGFYALEEPMFHLSNLTNTCQIDIEVPVQLAALNGVTGMEQLRQVMRKGFEVIYYVDNNHCAACRSTGGLCASVTTITEQQFICYCPGHGRENVSCPGKKKLNATVKVIIGISACLGGLGISAFIYLYIDKKKHAHASPNISSDLSSMANLERGIELLGIPRFTYAELEQATNHFSSDNQLGNGGFGTVYYGKLQDGRDIAVKRLYEHNYRRVEQFMNEVELLTHLCHQHLVILYGCGFRHDHELLLVYEYVSNGTVEDHLHGEPARSGALPWATRLKIAIESASALQHLHSSSIVHRDVKTSNILLDDNFSVKVADFGISRLFPEQVTHVSTAPQGTPGYIDPEYRQRYQLTLKSDVFSFGVVLVELISSQPAFDTTRQEVNLVDIFIDKIQRMELHELIDPSFGFETNYSMWKMIHAVSELAFQCLQSDKNLRPDMTIVLNTLKDIQIQDKGKGVDTSEEIVLLKNSEISMESMPSTSYGGS